MLDDLNYLNQFKVIDQQKSLADFFDYHFSSKNSASTASPQIIALSENQSDIALETLVTILNRLGLKAKFLNYESFNHHQTSLKPDNLFITSANWQQAEQLAIISQLINHRSKLELIKCQTINPELELLSSSLRALDRLKLIKPEAANQLNSGFAQARQVLDDWSANQLANHNRAKQLANFIAGRSGYLIYANELGLVARWWQMAINRRANNLCFIESIDQFVDFGKDGWWSHPVDKPFAVLDLISNRTPQTDNQFFFAKDRVLSGKIPHSKLVELSHSSLIDSFWVGVVLGELTAGYLASLNKQPIDARQINLKIF